MRPTLGSFVLFFALASLGVAQQPGEKTAVPADEGQWVGAPVSLSLRHADVAEVLRSFAREFDLRVVIREDISGPTTVELRQVQWDRALDSILRVNGLVGEVEDGLLRVRRAEGEEKSGLRGNASTLRG